VRLKLFRELDFKMPFDKERMEDLVDSGQDHEGSFRGTRRQSSTLREYRHVIEEQEDPTIDPYIDGSVTSWKTAISPNR